MILAPIRLSPVAASAALILIVRCVFFAAFGEALKGRAKLNNSPLEPAKIVLSFAGLGLAMSPFYERKLIGLEASLLATGFLVAAAALTVLTLVGYARITVNAISKQ